MGRGAVIVGYAAEMLIPTLIVFAVVYIAAKNSFKLADSSLRIGGLFLASFVLSGLVNVLFHRVTSNPGTGSLLFFAIPLLVSFGIVAVFGKRHSPEQKP